MKIPFIPRPGALAALAGLALAVGLAVVPAQASSTAHYAKPSSTGTIGNGAAPGGPVTREQVVARAQDWVKQQVPYSQGRWWKDAATGGSYRQDCSGFVSMAWQLKDSLTTRSLPSVANRITRLDQLEAGDALDYPEAHAVLFGGWTDKARGDFFYYSESRPGRPARKESANIHDGRIAGHPRTAYVPLRYKKITTTPAQAAQPPKSKPKPDSTAATPGTGATTTTAKPKPQPKPKPSTVTAPGPKAGTTASAAAPPSATKPPAGTAPSPVITAAPPGTSGPAPGGGCTPAVRVSFWTWLFDL